MSGGVNAAAAGTLTFMVGADSEAAFATAKQILESMGAKVRFLHGPNNYKDTKPSLLVFNRVYRLENGDTVRHVGIFDIF